MEDAIVREPICEPKCEPRESEYATCSHSGLIDTSRRVTCSQIASIPGIAEAVLVTFFWLMVAP